MNLLPYHVEFLRKELATRQERNGRYSMRAFASLLDVHPSALSRILTGKQTLSLKSAVLVIKKLQLTGEERLRFARSLARARHEEFCNDLCSGVEGALTPAELLSTGENSALPASKLPHGELVHFLPQPTWLFDLDGLILQGNQQPLEPGAVILRENLRMQELVSNEDWPIFEENWKRSSELGRGFELRCRLAQSERTFFLQILPMRDEARKIVRWLATANQVAAEQSNQATR